MFQCSLLLVPLFLAMSCGKKLPPAEAQLAQACEYLWEQQGSDGGWHSKHHGILKGGEAWTPFVLFSLMSVPDSVYTRPAGQFRDGLNFMRERIRQRGAMGISDPAVLEYPNYATAYALRILQQSTEPNDAILVRQMDEYLRQQQFDERRGITPDHAAYGSWGFGERNLKTGQVGHIDLSHTRRVLQALAPGAINLEARAKSRLFLRLLQKQPHEDRLQPAGGENQSAKFDGGFYFSSTVSGANKGGVEADSSIAGFRSYATATCDGLLALLASGAGMAAQPVQAAMAWLKQHPQLAYPEGIPDNTAEQWQQVLFYYHLAVRSEVYRTVDWPGNWRSDIYLLLKDRQAEDGSFRNPHGELNKEDDPILATALVVQTLQNILY